MLSQTSACTRATLGVLARKLAALGCECHAAALWECLPGQLPDSIRCLSVSCAQPGESCTGNNDFRSNKQLLENQTETDHTPLCQSARVLNNVNQTELAGSLTLPPFLLKTTSWSAFLKQQSRQTLAISASSCKANKEPSG